MEKKQNILAVNLTPDVNARLEGMARLSGMAKNAIARLAIEAAIRSFEENGGRFVVPIEFDVRHVPARKPVREEVALVSEDPHPFRKSRSA